MNLFLAILLIIFVFVFGLIPFSALYIISDLIGFLLYHVIGYRKEVMIKNLSQTFPDLTKNELKRLVRLSYKNLADVTVEGIKGFTMTRKQVMKRHRILNPKILEPYFSIGKSIITTPNHYGNWEWGTLSPGLFFKNYTFVVFYKPLNNPYADRYLRKNRSRTGTKLTSIYETAKCFKDAKHNPTLFIMAADQSPSNARRAYWVQFLGRRTAFLHGPEKYARDYNLPVFFVDIQRIKRGYYTLELSLIADNSSDLKEGEITQRYASKLEEVIRKQPENWLWSHRRWKLNP